MNAEKLRTASKLWRQGVPGREIAKTIGVKCRMLYDTAARYRSMFPKRHHAVEPRFSAPPIEDEQKLSEVREGCMHWITETGASVTLPRISFIECPRRKDIEWHGETTSYGPQ